ncbi:hypothetical protein SNEBB_000516 [Seison nebaliae]|nr:hypothetical protein SNEBB_000516 [Seison nebaliae]
MSDDSLNHIDQLKTLTRHQLSRAPKLRLCHLKQTSDFNGYGFNLFSSVTDNIQTIGRVDDNSPAAIAELRDRDILLEVNGASIFNEDHSQVVQRIRRGFVDVNGKKYSDHVQLLVISPEDMKWYRQHNIEANKHLPSTLIKCYPCDGLNVIDVNNQEKYVEKSMTREIDIDQMDKERNASQRSNKEMNHTVNSPSSSPSVSLSPSLSSRSQSTMEDVKREGDRKPSPQRQDKPLISKDETKKKKRDVKKKGDRPDIFNMTVEQYRLQLSQRKKLDPRLSNTMKQEAKIRLFQEM